jgi:hypothetical protein
MWIVKLSNELISSQNVLCYDNWIFIFLLACAYLGFIITVILYSMVSHSNDNVTISRYLRHCCVINNTDVLSSRIYRFWKYSTRVHPSHFCQPILAKFNRTYSVISLLMRQLPVVEQITVDQLTLG